MQSKINQIKKLMTLFKKNKRNKTFNKTNQTLKNK